MVLEDLVPPSCAGDLQLHLRRQWVEEECLEKQLEVVSCTRSGSWFSSCVQERAAHLKCMKDRSKELDQAVKQWRERCGKQ